MDFMEQEQDRGITISSAATTCYLLQIIYPILLISILFFYTAANVEAHDNTKMTANSNPNFFIMKPPRVF